MYAPAVHDELDTMIGYIEQQLDAIRAATYGLTEEQARQCPCRSALSVAGIVKHIARVMRGTTRLLTSATPPALDPARFAEHQASFSLTDEETTIGTLDEFDEARQRFREVLAAADPDAEMLAPPAPWFGIFEPRPVKLRYHLGHQIEEIARHAGHADIIREQVDGVSIASLVLTLEGTPANDFFQPFVPEPGTIGASQSST